MDKLDIKSMNLSELKAFVKELGEPEFRALQLFKWLQSGVTNFDDMTNLSKIFRSKICDNAYIADTIIEKKLVSKLDGTVKYLFKLYDGEYIETVLMKYNHGYSVCISTQVGCRMGCSFCASGRNGLLRNLTASEMLSQIMTVSRDNGVRVSNVVMMGIGEPLDNFDQTVRFLQLVSDENGLNIGLRHISLSTSGVVPNIYKLAEYAFPITLSVSLHAPNDEIRNKTMKVNRKWNVETLLKACKDYQKITTRRISFEYALISGINDSDKDAMELASRLKGLMCHVNLIPANPVNETDFKKPDIKNIKRFQATLEKCGITATVRRTLGADINASCGQLRQKSTEERQGITNADLRSN